MKTQIIKAVFALMLIIPTGLIAQTKSKIGHVNSNDLLLLMPERKTAETDLQTFAKSLEDQLSSMTSEYEKKLTEYQTNAQVMAAPVRESKEEELGSLEQRIRDFQVKAQQSIQTKEQELMQPMLEKANTAIEAVAKENEYSYILDTSAGVVLYFPEADDILPLVKTKLGIQ